MSEEKRPNQMMIKTKHQRNLMKRETKSQKDIMRTNSKRRIQKRMKMTKMKRIPRRKTRRVISKINLMTPNMTLRFRRRKWKRLKKWLKSTTRPRRKLWKTRRMRKNKKRRKKLKDLMKLHKREGRWSLIRRRITIERSLMPWNKRKQVINCGLRNGPSTKLLWKKYRVIPHQNIRTENLELLKTHSLRAISTNCTRKQTVRGILKACLTTKRRIEYLNFILWKDNNILSLLSKNR
jgi:hypothetical protein